MCNACIYPWVEEDKFITAGQYGFDNVGVTAFDDPALVTSNPAFHILNTVLKRTSFRTSLKSHLIQRQPGSGIPGDKLPGQGAFARSSVSKQDNFHCFPN
jgi:hypothetical protein